MVTTLIVFVSVGFGGLEKSISEDSLSEEVDSEADEDDEGGVAFLVIVAVNLWVAATSSDSLPDDELYEEEADCALEAAVIAVTGLEGSVVDSLSDKEVFEEEEVTDGAEAGKLL